MNKGRAYGAFYRPKLNGKNKSTVNRQRFLRRHKQQIKESIADAVNKRSITDVESGEDITIRTVTSASQAFTKAEVDNAKLSTQATTSSAPETELSAPKEGAAKAVLVKDRPAQMVRARMNSYSKSPKMSISIYSLRIWNCQTSRRISSTKLLSGKRSARAISRPAYRPILPL